MSRKTTGRPPGRPPHPELLTPSEQRVLEWLRDGLTNAEIAVRLGISPDGVKYHVSNMLSKLHLSGREELARWKPPRSAPAKRLWLPVGLGSFLAVAGGVAIAGIVFYQAGDEPSAAATPAAVAQAATPTPGIQSPMCAPPDVALSMRVEPWFGSNLITVESENHGPACLSGTEVNIPGFPTSMIGLPPFTRSRGSQDAVQLVWDGGCALAGRVADLTARVGSANTTLNDVPARGCARAEGDALFPVQKLDPIDVPWLNSCSTAQLSMEAEVESSGPAVVVSVRVANSGAPCRLRGSLTLEVLDEGGDRVTRIFANPDTVGVYADVAGELGAPAFAWENWCEPAGRFAIRLTLGGLSTTTSTSPPSCGVGPGMESQLRSTPGARLLVPLARELTLPAEP
ncbi:MAG: LuxR C-terminal-related transcriptional regulator [Dehalococcoidia bacterium]